MVRQAHGPEQRRRTHHPEQGRRVNLKFQYSMTKTFTEKEWPAYAAANSFKRVMVSQTKGSLRQGMMALLVKTGSDSKL